MIISEQWLREWVNPPLETDALAEQLTMAGLEVDAAYVTVVAFGFMTLFGLAYCCGGVFGVASMFPWMQPGGVFTEG